MARHTLKPGWQVWRFEQMAQNVQDRIDRPVESGLERFVGLEHLDSGSLKIWRWGSTADVEQTKLLFKQGDIIFGRRNAYLRRVAVADFAGVCSAHAMVLRAKPDVVLPAFLPFFMQTDMFWEAALKVSAGSMSPTINWPNIAQEEFALPPMEEQRRIADILGGVEESLESLDDLESKTAAVRKSYLVDAFSRIIHEPQTRTVKITDVGEVLMGRQRSPKYDRGISPRPYLRVANVFDGYIDTTDVKVMDFSEIEFEEYRLIPGDVLLVEGHSSAEVVGRSSIYRDEVSNCCFQNTLIRFRPKKVSPEYSHYYFQYCLYTGRFSVVAKQTTIAHLGRNRFASMEFLLADAKVEQQIVDELTSIESSLQSIIRRKATIEQLKRLILEIVLPH
ncbi:MAG: restriction endonuclease subunit S [Anaerolineae bacterium]|nr:restriction endonuclease subunit S [Anaerolineae bacterium]